MAAIVVDGVVRYAVHQEFMGRQVVNIVDMFMLDPAVDPPADVGAETRTEAIREQAEIIAKQWKADLMGHLANELTIQSVSWVDLDSLDGGTGSFSGSTETPLPSPGAAGAESASANVAILVRKGTSSPRGRKEGRMFLCGMHEALTNSSDPNHLTAAAITGFQEGLTSFLGNINQDGTILTGEFKSHMVVVHHAAGTTASATPVSSLQVQSLLATQRRRLRG